jgi:hypothetical protein
MRSVGSFVLFPHKGWAEHVGERGEICIGKPEEIKSLEDVVIDGRMMLRTRYLV